MVFNRPIYSFSGIPKERIRGNRELWIIFGQHDVRRCDTWEEQLALQPCLIWEGLFPGADPSGLAYCIGDHCREWDLRNTLIYKRLTLEQEEDSRLQGEDRAFREEGHLQTQIIRRLLLLLLKRKKTLHTRSRTRRHRSRTATGWRGSWSRHRGWAVWHRSKEGQMIKWIKNFSKKQQQQHACSHLEAKEAEPHRWPSWTDSLRWWWKGPLWWRGTFAACLLASAPPTEILPSKNPEN